MLNTIYFNGVKNLEELRTRYKDLLKANHPDNGGDVGTMQEINAEYDKAFKALKAGAKLEDEKEAIKWSEAEDELIRKALYKIIHLEGLNIEIVGCWIWIDGETFANREVLKPAGYTWSKARKKWHYAPYESRYHKGSKKPFDEIRRIYGSKNVETERPERITA